MGRVLLVDSGPKLTLAIVKECHRIMNKATPTTCGTHFIQTVEAQTIDPKLFRELKMKKKPRANHKPRQFIGGR